MYIATSGHNPQFHSIGLLHHLTLLIFTFSSLSDYPGVEFLIVLLSKYYRMSLLIPPPPTVPSKNFNLRKCNLEQFNSQIQTHYLERSPPHSVENVQLFNSNQKLAFHKNISPVGRHGYKGLF